MIHDMSDHLPCKISISNMYPLKNKDSLKEVYVFDEKHLEAVKLELQKN